MLSLTNIQYGYTVYSHKLPKVLEGLPAGSDEKIKVPGKSPILVSWVP